MFTEKIKLLREYCTNSDERLCKKLKTKQFGDMLCIIMDKGLLDESEASNKVIQRVDEAFEILVAIMNEGQSDTKSIRRYNRLYMKAIEAVRKAYGLEPAGTIAGRWVGIGIAMGSGIGAALMSVIGPAMMSAGIGIGLAIGAGIGQTKEREARDQGKLF